MEEVQHTMTDWWAISAFSTQLLKCNSTHEIEDAAKVTVNEPKTPDGACYLELKVPSRSKRDGCWNFVDRYGYCYADAIGHPLLPLEDRQIIGLHFWSNSKMGTKTLERCTSE
ncbi:hypothetical protein Tco_1202475, partial [Tanacetum coccineum]